jgi:MFS family permease
MDDLNGRSGGCDPYRNVRSNPEIMGKPELAGIGLGAVGTGQNLGMFLGPVIFGALVESSGWAVAGYWMIPVLALGFIAGWLVKVK